MGQLSSLTHMSALFWACPLIIKTGICILHEELWWLSWDLGQDSLTFPGRLLYKFIYKMVHGKKGLWLKLSSHPQSKLACGFLMGSWVVWYTGTDGPWNLQKMIWVQNYVHHWLFCRLGAKVALLQKWRVTNFPLKTLRNCIMAIFYWI